jgi:hypothetical protein
MVSKRHWIRMRNAVFFQISDLGSQFSDKFLASETEPDPHLFLFGWFRLRIRIRNADPQHCFWEHRNATAYDMDPISGLGFL